MAVLIAFCALPVAVHAQEAEQAYIQIQALPNRAEAEAGLKELSGGLADLKGFETAGGWNVLVIGPMSPENAAGRLVELRQSGQIPRDAFITDGAGFGAALASAGDGATTDPVGVAEEPVATEPVATADPIIVAPDETKAEATASERALTRDDRKAIQSALAWYGHYDGTIDGAFGPGTRASMQAWQTAVGLEPTGVLTTLQRATLTANHQADQAELGMELVNDPEAGIEALLPLGLIGFDRYDPPFARYSEKNGSGLTVLLISEPGDGEALAGLYDLIQTLDIMPPNGERARKETSFEINGLSDKVQTLAYAEADRGLIKGYILTWDPTRADRIVRAIPALRSSFRSVGDQVLDPGMVPLDQAVKTGILAGMTLRKPVFSRSGAFVDAKGSVLTLAEGLQTCDQVTVDFDQPAKIGHVDPASGLAVLLPDAPLSPLAVLAWSQAVPQPASPVTLAGFSFGDRLPAAALTPGVLNETTGLDGASGLMRLTLATMDADQGGPVMDQTGAAIGILVPNTDKTRTLPPGVAFARDAITAMAVMTDAGLTPVLSSANQPATPDALEIQGMGMTTLVSCWKD